MTDGIGKTRGFIAAVLLALIGMWPAWLCLRAAVIEGLPYAAAMRIVPDNPGRVLDQAIEASLKPHAALPPGTLAAVRKVAATAPLDARPYLILGHQQLADGQYDRALATLTAGERLDPRQPLIHMLLLDRYLHAKRYSDAAAQMSVLTRLIGETQSLVAAALAQMSLSPDTRDAVRHTLRSDPELERGVLLALVKSGTAPDAILALASPAARIDAREKNSWGPFLVAKLVEQYRFATARSVWKRIFAIDDAAANAPIFNTGFASAAASPPFNWTLVADSLGAADLRGGGLSVDYYGRDSGDLAGQLLVLAPGRYRFSFTVDAGKTDSAAKLFWSLTCIDAKEALTNVAVVAGPSPRRLSGDVLVPANCPAQQLTLRGEAGDFPATTSVTVRAPLIRPAPITPS